ncbi:MAG TPA: hypothetical protein DD621_02645 [Clostridiales bacterium]|nr:hypothetical protein [Clostridiales bacterium]
MTYNQLIINNFFTYFDEYKESFYSLTNQDHKNFSICYEGLSLRIMEGANVKVIHPPVDTYMYDDTSTEYLILCVGYNPKFVNRVGDSSFVSVALKPDEVRLFTYTLVEKDGKIVKNFMERFRDGTIKNYGTLSVDNFNALSGSVYDAIVYGKI